MLRLSAALIHQQKQIGGPCHSLDPWPKPCGVWDICQILLDQRMTITQTGIHIPPTAALEGSWPLSTGQVEKHRWDRGHTHAHHWFFKHKHYQMCSFISCDTVSGMHKKCYILTKLYSTQVQKAQGLFLVVPWHYPTSTSFYNPSLIRERMSWSSSRRRWSVEGLLLFR